ncbi:MAG: DUF4342 domain-containing protein [Spirochaetia bacterium]
MNNRGSSWKDEFVVAGNKAVDRIKELIQEGNVRKIVLKKETGEVLFELPMNAGVAVGAGVTLMAPVIAAIGASAALLTKVKLEVHRLDE